MARKLGLIGLVLALVVAAAVLYSRARGATVPGVGARPLAQAIEAPIASHDSVTVAKFAQQRCQLLVGKPKQTCFDEILLALVQRNQVRLAMDALSVLSRMDDDISRHGHDFTHVVGINAWSPGKDLGQVYDSCTGLYQSGCYHGVVQAYLDANGSDSTTVASVCKLIPSAQTNMWLRFQCVHGIGHGMVQNTGLHLRKALEGCDWLVDGWDAQSCYGGAFMEFILAGRGQEHHPHKPRLDSASASHGEHAHHETTSDTFAIRNPNDPLYPCSALANRYQSACYGMQAGIIIETTGPDFGKIAKACDGAPLNLRSSCYQGIGTYVSGFTGRNPGKAIDLCMAGNPGYRHWCFVGVVKNFIDVTALAEDGMDFCRRLSDRPLATSCYVAVGEEVGILRRDHTEREKECAKADPAYVDACRYGAVLIAERPKDLPPPTPAT